MLDPKMKIMSMLSEEELGFVCFRIPVRGQALIIPRSSHQDTGTQLCGE